MASIGSLAFIVTFFLPFRIISSDPGIYKMCGYENYDSYSCKGLEAGNSPIICSKVSDSAECTVKLTNGEVDFGLFFPEQAILAAKLASEDIKVIGELRFKNMLNVSDRYRAVVVVPANFTGKFEELRDKSYCHPGFGYAHSFTDRVLKHFERTVVPMPCTETVSIVEQEVAYLSGFFKSACRPGPWAHDDQLDDRLKSKYKDLCDLCDSKDCKYNMRAMGTEGAVLNCLTKESGGDVAYVSYREVQKYFGLISGHEAKANASNYQFLCPDQTVRRLNGDTPCTWFRQPWPTLLARKDLADDLQEKMISQWLNTDVTPPSGEIWREALKKLILSNSYSAVNISRPKSVSNYFDRGVDSDPAVSSCKKPVKWCTLNEAQGKECSLLSKAASTHGMLPGLECVSSQNKWNCMHHISVGNADVMSMDTEYGYIAREIYNLTTVVFEDGAHDQYFQILTVIKSDSNIKSFKDIRNKKACFPEYRGLGWVSFVRAMKQNGLLKKNTYPEKLLGSSCAPGAMDKNHITDPISTQNKLCQLCPSSNTTEQCSISEDPKDSNPFYGDLGAIKCLLTDGDVAFIDYMRLLTGGGIANLDNDKFRVLCRNGSVSSTPGLNVGDECALSIGIRGEILAWKDKTGVEIRDTSELFLKMDNWFGTFGTSPEEVFRMYKSKRYPEDNLFSKGTIMLVQKDNINFKMVDNYINLLKEGSDEVNSSTKLTASFLIVLTIFFHF